MTVMCIKYPHTYFVHILVYITFTVGPGEAFRFLLSVSRSDHKAFGTRLLKLMSHCFGTLKIVLSKNRKYGVDVVQCKVKKTALFYLFQATGGSWRRKIPGSKRFCRELFGWVECYNQ